MPSGPWALPTFLPEQTGSSSLNLQHFSAYNNSFATLAFFFLLRRRLIRDLEHTIDGVVLFLLAFPHRAKSHKAPSHDRRLLVHVRLWAGGLFSSSSFFFYKFAKKVGDGMREPYSSSPIQTTCGFQETGEFAWSQEWGLKWTWALLWGVFFFFLRRA